MDDFEQFLKSQPLQKVPAAWRGEILAEARKRKMAPASYAAGWRGWLWPSPYAWGALAAVWVAIFVLNAAAEPKREFMAAKEPAPSPEQMVMLLDEQRREMDELLPAKKAEATAPTEPARTNKPGARLEQPKADKLFHA